MVIFVVDAHNDYQAGLNIPQVAAEGYSGLIVKATQGATGYTAPAAFDTWISQARAAGMVVGAYHWLTKASASAQLDHFLGRIGNTDDMLCAVDVEETNENAPTKKILEEFIDGFNYRTKGHPLLVYSSNWWWSRLNWDIPVGNTHLWDSRYVTGSDYGSALYTMVPDSWWTPRYGNWGETDLLQFTSQAAVAGKRVDVSAFRGTIEELRALARPGAGGSGGGDDMAGEVADFAAANVPVPDEDGAVCGSQVALGAIWADLGSLSTKVSDLTTKVDGVTTPKVTLTDEDLDRLSRLLIAGMMEVVADAAIDRVDELDENVKP